MKIYGNIALTQVIRGRSLMKNTIKTEDEGSHPSASTFHSSSNISAYLTALVKSVPSYIPTSEDSKKIRFQGMESLLFEKLTTSKFRTAPVPDKIKKRIIEACKYSLESKSPLHLTLPFGGYKLPQMPGSPSINWAEVFSLVQLRNYLAQIASLCPSGVLLEYYSDEIVVHQMNDIPQSSLDTYNNQLSELVSYFNTLLPAGMTLKYSKIRDHISEKELFRRFELADTSINDWWKSLPSHEQDDHLAKAKKNYYGNLEGLSTSEQRSILTKSFLIHESLVKSHWDHNITWAFGDGRIPIGFQYANNWGIQVKSSQSSSIQFWVGLGILTNRSTEYMPQIIGYEAYKESQPSLKNYSVEVFPESFSSLREILVRS